MSSFLPKNKITKIGLGSCGENVKISSLASFHNPKNIHIGNNVRIDDFCVFSSGIGGIYIGNYVHISVFSALIGAGKIELSDYAGISSRVTIYSSNDDYSGNYLTNPTIPYEFTNVKHENVFVGKHVIIGSGSVILPGTRIEDGVAIGSLSLVKSRCNSFYIYAGIPAKKIRTRSKGLLNLEKKFINSIKKNEKIQ